MVFLLSIAALIAFGIGMAIYKGAWMLLILSVGAIALLKDHPYEYRNSRFRCIHRTSLTAL